MPPEDLQKIKLPLMKKTTLKDIYFEVEVSIVLYLIEKEEIKF